MHILPFTADMVEDAAKLLASRHQKDRLATAALPCRFEREQDAPIAIEAEWNKQGTTGAAAIKMGSSSAIFSGNKRQHNYRCQEHSFGWRPWMTDKRWETFLHGFGPTMGERIGKGGKWKWQQLQ
ncbi:hypothetical protein P9761_11605 [Brevibacillus centrosporus]|uniref:hypothetical protein n=1 Tax=Brevibacillus centrosporus TaxID=54910 RepID=UPI002E221D46|nr:hypothetical protein [Brevibacillus centrosporus]